MGFVTGLLTLPLAPVRGVVAIAEALARIAEEEMDDEDALRAEIRELADLRDAGLIDEDEFEAGWDHLSERIAAGRSSRQKEEAETWPTRG